MVGPSVKKSTNARYPIAGRLRKTRPTDKNTRLASITAQRQPAVIGEPMPGREPLRCISSASLEKVIAEDGETCAVTLTWEAPATEHCRISGNVVRVTLADGSSCGIPSIEGWNTLRPSQTQFRFAGLTPGETYNFQLIAKAEPVDHSDELKAYANFDKVEMPLPPEPEPPEPFHEVWRAWPPPV